MRQWKLKLSTVRATIVGLSLALSIPFAHAEIDGHGPDAWRVTGVAANDTLNARMGPGTNYPVIETFSHNERGMKQVTCVPFYTAAHYTRMTQQQIEALPSRWCLMRNRSLSKAGWVAQRYITPDNGTGEITMAAPRVSQVTPSAHGQRTAAGDMMIENATTLVRRLYDAQSRAETGHGADPLFSDAARKYFDADIVALFQSGQIDAHPLYGAQDFDGHIVSIAPDPDQPMLRGMITINVDFTNFGRQKRAVYYLRPDNTQPGAPLLIFSVDHEGWSYP